MSMAEVIESIEREAFREAQSREIGGRNGEPIDCSTLEDEPVIVANNEADMVDMLSLILTARDISTTTVL